MNQTVPELKLNSIPNFDAFRRLFGDSMTEEHGSGRSATVDCNDIHSVFAFLAFLFALLNFIVNMNPGGGRKKRSENCHHNYLSEVDIRRKVS